MLSPWRAAADAAAWVSERSGVRWETPFAYPERWGRWPGAVLLLRVRRLRARVLGYGQPPRDRGRDPPLQPRDLARDARLRPRRWTENGEGFAVYFGLLARIAPFGERDGRLVVALAVHRAREPRPRPGTLAFIAVMLGSVAFDGFSQTDYWAVEVRAKLTREVIQRSPTLADVVGGLLASRASCS